MLKLQVPDLNVGNGGSLNFFLILIKNTLKWEKKVSLDSTASKRTKKRINKNHMLRFKREHRYHTLKHHK
jgi:hypothetical protein